MLKKDIFFLFNFNVPCVVLCVCVIGQHYMCTRTVNNIRYPNDVHTHTHDEQQSNVKALPPSKYNIPRALSCCRHRHCQIKDFFKIPISLTKLKNLVGSTFQ